MIDENLLTNLYKLYMFIVQSSISVSSSSSDDHGNPKLQKPDGKHQKVPKFLLDELKAGTITEFQSNWHLARSIGQQHPVWMSVMTLTIIGTELAIMTVIGTQTYLDIDK